MFKRTIIYLAVISVLQSRKQGGYDHINQDGSTETI